MKNDFHVTVIKSEYFTLNYESEYHVIIHTR